MSFNTHNTLGSVDDRDVQDNAANLDLAVNSLSQTFVDRLGRTRDTLEGIYQKSSYYRAGTFAAGYTLTNNRQTLAYGNVEYSWSGVFPKVVAAGSTPETSGGIGAGAWVDRTQETLRSELSSPGGSSLVGNGDGTVSSELLGINEKIDYSIASGFALMPISSASDLYAIGDSQTAGSNAATGVDYTDGVGRLLPQYRWPNIVAGFSDRNMRVVSFAIGGQRLGWNASGNANWSIFNQMGNLGPYIGAYEQPHTVCVMGGWNSVNPYSTTEEFYKIVRKSHEANIARLLIDHWGGITHLGWADISLGGQAVGATPGFTTTAGISESISDTVTSDKMSFNPFYYGDTSGGRWVTRLTNGQYSQLTLTNQRACAVFLETDPANQGVATITVNGTVVASVDCHWTSAFNDDRWPVVVWIENLPSSADVRVTCEVGGDKSVRFLAFGWTAKDSGIARRRTIIYGTTVANSANQHDPIVLYNCAKQVEAAVGSFADYSVLFANPFNSWVESTDQEPQDISHLTPSGNLGVAKAFLSAAHVPKTKSNNIVYL